MSDVAAAIDRTYRDYLNPPDDQPSRTRLSAGIDNATETVPYESALLSPEEEDLLGEGVVVEAARELMLVRSIDVTAKDLTVTRGYLGTTAVAHSSGDLLYVAPTYPRQTVFDAVADAIEELWPTLWKVKSHRLTTGSGFVEVPSDAESVLGFRFNSGGRWHEGQAILLTDFDESSTGRAVQTYSAPAGRTAYLTYKARTIRPTAEADTLASLNVEDVWVPMVVVKAAAFVLASADIDAHTQEFITESLEREGFPVGSGRDIRDGLLRLYTFSEDRAQRALRHGHTEAVIHNPVTF